MCLWYSPLHDVPRAILISARYRESVPLPVLCQWRGSRHPRDPPRSRGRSHPDSTGQVRYPDPDRGGDMVLLLHGSSNRQYLMNDGTDII